MNLHQVKVFLRSDYLMKVHADKGSIQYMLKKPSNAKGEKKNDNKGIKLIKTFIKNMYYLYGKINGGKKIIKEYKQ